MLGLELDAMESGDSSISHLEDIAEAEIEYSKRKGRGFEANVMAILDSAGVKEARDLEDDRHSFLEAVQSACLMSGSGSVPTRKVFEAIFQILKDDTSLELKMASYRLLRDLEKRFPQVHLAKSESSRSTTVELVVVEEAWSPFVTGWEGAYREEVTTRISRGPLDSHPYLREGLQSLHDVGQSTFRDGRVKGSIWWAKLCDFQRHMISRVGHLHV